MPPKTEQKNEQKGSFWKELVTYTLFALVIVVPIRIWIAQPFVVNGSSMDSTFKDGEYLIVDEVSYRFNEPERGDVVIFKYPMNTSKYFIKRLIGLPGETIIIKDGSITIKNAAHPQGVELEETYIKFRTWNNLTRTLGEGEYFAMGDNRLASSDSRDWGPLPREDIIGRPIVRLLPLSRIDWKPGKVASSTILKI